MPPPTPTYLAPDLEKEVAAAEVVVKEEEEKFSDYEEASRVRRRIERFLHHPLLLLWRVGAGRADCAANVVVVAAAAAAVLNLRQQR